MAGLASFFLKGWLFLARGVLGEAFFVLAFKGDIGKFPMSKSQMSRSPGPHPIGVPWNQRGLSFRSGTG